jgi:endonuclease/exonuclease/phosphatase (EEP) superfamily protein YafD
LYCDGGFNDVAWSRTTLFQRISGLLDPRVGRILLILFMRTILYCAGLDHIFHSTDFGLVKMQRLSHIGSDHFPVYVVLQTGRIFEQIQEELEQTQDDEEEAQERYKKVLQS